MIDLHTHSTASDGTAAPADLVAQAEGIGLQALALTDHDTLEGLPEFLACRPHTSVELVAGVEISASWYGASLHIVGLFVNCGDSGLEALLQRVRTARAERNERMLERLRELGLPLPEALLREIAGRGVVGRPHLAAAMARCGYCRDAAEAFQKYLGHGKPGYVRRFLPLPDEIITTIKAAGGVSVWAHPLGLRKLPRTKLRRTARTLVGHGLDAVETVYSEYTSEQARVVDGIAEEFSLLPSGGSDYHGDHTPGISLGRGYGDLRVPVSFLAAMRQLALARQQSREPNAAPS